MADLPLLIVEPACARGLRLTFNVAHISGVRSIVATVLGSQRVAHCQTDGVRVEIKERWHGSDPHASVERRLPGAEWGWSSFTDKTRRALTAEIDAALRAHDGGFVAAWTAAVRMSDRVEDVVANAASRARKARVVAAWWDAAHALAEEWAAGALLAVNLPSNADGRLFQVAAPERWHGHHDWGHVEPRFELRRPGTGELVGWLCDQHQVVPVSPELRSALAETPTRRVAS